MRRLGSTPGVPCTLGFGTPAQENDSMNAETTHPRGKHIKVRAISPIDMQLMVISAPVENNVFMPHLSQASLVSVCNASQSYGRCLLSPV